MPPIEATDSRTIRVRVPMADVYAFFLDPAMRQQVMPDLERFEVLDEHTVRWILVEKREKGIRFQADYTVVFEGNGSDEVRWRATEGNMGNTGTVLLRSLDGGFTEVRYTELMAPDLPIPRLLAKVFRPIVAREVRQGIGQMIDNVEAYFEGR